MRHSSWLGQKGGDTVQGCSGEKDMLLGTGRAWQHHPSRSESPCAGIFAWHADQLYLVRRAEKWRKLTLLCIKCMNLLVKKWERGGG